MNDVFVEQIIERRQDAGIIGKKLAITAAGLIVSAAFLFFGVVRFLFPFVFAASIWAAVVLSRRMNLEYEYSFTNGDLDVDCIVARRSRSKLLSVSIRTFDILAPKKEEFRSEYESQTIGKTVFAASSPKSESQWFAKYKDESGTMVLLIFEPNERMLEAFRKFIPRKIRDGSGQ